MKKLKDQNSIISVHDFICQEDENKQNFIVMDLKDQDI